MRLNQNHFGDGGGLLTIFVGLDVLAQLGHYGAQLQVEFTQITVCLQLGAQLVVGLALLVLRLVVEAIVA